MRSSDINRQISCPSCEFEQENSGEPIRRDDGSYTCNSCKTVWRELGMTPLINKPQPIHKAEDIPEDILPPAFSCPSSQFHTVPVKNDGLISQHRIPLIIVGCMVVLMGAALFHQFGSLFHPQLIDHRNQHQLTIDDITIEDITNRDTPVWIISAIISNATANALAIPPITMSSGRKGSSGYFDWTYRPALQKLAPGTKLTIRTAIRRPAGIHNDIRLEFVSDQSSSG